jgi:TonB family protein
LTDARTRHTRGLLVVIGLAVLFFTLLALILLRTGGEEPETPRTEMLTVLPIRIRIRTEPTARAAVVATATTGETLRLVEDQGAWVRVEKDDGLSGWAERAYLERTAERERRLSRFAAIRRLPSLAGVTTTRTPLYAGPGIFYPLAGELPAGTSVKVYTRDHDFYAVDYQDQIAYADVESIDVTASGSPQFDVATSTVPTETTASIEPVPPPTETIIEPEPPAMVPSDLRDSSGVYAAVPPGGTQPEEIDRVVPRYPSEARRAGVQGAVVIRGIVRKDGTIDEVEIIKDLPNGLGDAARDAVRRWRFRPATVDGEAIDVYYTVTVNFRLR